MRPTLIFLLDSSKKHARTGKTPIYMRIIFKRKKTDVRLLHDVSDDLFHRWDPFTMRFMERNNPINNYLSYLESRFQNLLITAHRELNEYDTVKIKDHILEIRNEKPNEISLIKYVDNYLNDVINPNRQLSKGTKINYKKSVNHLKSFLEYNKLEKLLLVKFSNSIATKFKDYLVNDIPAIDKCGMAEVSAATIIKKLKPMMERAVLDEILGANPFKGIRLKNKSPLRDRLTIDQVKKLWELDLSNNSYLAVYRDIFLFSVFTGLAYQDAMNLKKTDIVAYDNDNLCIKIRRQKTDITTEVVIVKFVQEIIGRFNKMPETQILNSILPKRSNQKVNKVLKELAGRAEIPFELSTHIARHTFRQLLAEAGIGDYGVIKRMLGQSRGGDVDEVYYSVTQSRLIDAKEKFELYLIKHLV